MTRSPEIIKNESIRAEKIGNEIYQNFQSLESAFTSTNNGIEEFQPDSNDLKTLGMKDGYINIVTKMYNRFTTDPVTKVLFDPSHGSLSISVLSFFSSPSAV